MVLPAFYQTAYLLRLWCKVVGNAIKRKRFAPQSPNPRRFLLNIGGVFHIIFFKDMEIIWRTQPSMLLARQAIILHLQHYPRFTVVTSIANFWTKEWKEYVDDKIPAFLLLTDAENIPWKTKRTKKQDLKIEFFFRSLLLHFLGHGLNCVFISGIQMTATKVLGFYIESFFDHKAFFKKVSDNDSPVSN